jgi:hypothetical protein
MKKNQEAFVGIDTATTHNAVAEVGRNGEVRYLGTFENTSGAVTKLIRKLAVPTRRCTFTMELGRAPRAATRSLRQRATSVPRFSTRHAPDPYPKLAHSHLSAIYGGIGVHRRCAGHY